MKSFLEVISVGVAFLLIVVFVGCKSVPSSSSATKAVVDLEQAEEAFSIVKAASEYIPYSYALDGCYARSLFLSMELATKKIPSSSQFVTCDDRSACLSANSWVYHVAPILFVDDRAKSDLYKKYLFQQVDGSEDSVDFETGVDRDSPAVGDVLILDPSLGEKPLKRTTWLQRLKIMGPATLVVVPGSYYEPYRPAVDPRAARLLRSFVDLPKFKLSDVQAACQTLFSHLEVEKHFSDDKQLYEQKQQKLLNRVSELIEILRDGNIDKIELDLDLDSFLCSKVIVPMGI